MRLVLAAATLAALSLLPAAPAGAASFAPAQATCAQHVSAVADGTVYGAGDCAGGVSIFVRRPGTAWRSLGLGWPDKQVEAVAADETATFVVMSCTMEQSGWQGADPLGKSFFIGKVPHGGRPSALTELGSTESGDTASVAARGGRWWAAWTSTIRDRDAEGSGSQHVMYRKTFGGVGSGQVPVPRDASGARTFSNEPSIALTGSGAVIAFVSQVEESTGPPTLQLATAGADGAFTTTAYAPAADGPAAAPDVTVSGGRTFVAWSRAGRPALAFARDGSTSRIDLPVRGKVTVAGPTVAASGGRVTVSTAETFSYQGGTTTRVYARSLDAQGALRSTTELTAAAGRQDPHVRGELTDSTAGRGTATVAYAAGPRRWTASQS
jgi:hypothetical protein